MGFQSKFLFFSFCTAMLVSNNVMATQIYSGGYALRGQTGKMSSAFGQIKSREGGLFQYGMFNGSIDFNPDPIGQDIRDAGTQTHGYLTYTDASRHYQWTREILCTGRCFYRSGTITSDGDLVLGGVFDGEISSESFGTSPFHEAYHGKGLFAVKLTTVGAVKWIRFFPIESEDLDSFGVFFSTAVLENATSRLAVLGGLFTGTITVSSGRTLLASGKQDALLIALDLNTGGLVRAGRIGSSNQESDIANIFAIETTPTGDIYVGGYFQGMANINPFDQLQFDQRNGPHNGSIFKTAAFLIKYNSKLAYQGGKVWADSSGENSAEVRALKFDGVNGLYVGGSFSGTVRWSSKSPAGQFGYKDIISQSDVRAGFVMRLNLITNGVDWLKSFTNIPYEATSASATYSFEIDSNNNLLVQGQFIGKVKFDPSSDGKIEFRGSGTPEVFLTSWNSAGEFQWSSSWGNAAGVMTFSTSVWSLQNGEISLAGGFNSSIQLDPNAPPNDNSTQVTAGGVLDIFTVRLRGL